MKPSTRVYGVTSVSEFSARGSAYRSTAAVAAAAAAMAHTGCLKQQLTSSWMAFCPVLSFSSLAVWSVSFQFCVFHLRPLYSSQPNAESHEDVQPHSSTISDVFRTPQHPQLRGMQSLQGAVNELKNLLRLSTRCRKWFKPHKSEPIAATIKQLLALTYAVWTNFDSGYAGAI